MDSNYENVFLIPMVRWCRGARELLPEGCAWKIGSYRSLSAPGTAIWS